MSFLLSSATQEGCSRGLRVRLGVLAALAAAAAWVAWRVEAPRVHAQGSAVDDSDGDGLPDGLELVLNLRPDLADTDGDGWSDGEELARGTQPDLATSVPMANSLPRIRVAMDAYLAAGDVHAVTTVYIPDGVLQGRRVQYSTVFGGGLLPMPLTQLRGGTRTRVLPAHDGVGVIVVLDPVVSEQGVLIRNGLALGAVVTDNGVIRAADAVNLAVVNGDIFEHVVTGYPSGVTEPEMTIGLGVGGVYRPLNSGGGNSNYTMGEICAQTTMVVGVVGALVTQEVVAAGCVTGWDAHCTPGCAATVGSTIKTIDPAALVGG